MYESPSKQNPALNYVFDEFRLPAVLLPGHPHIIHNGRVMETLDIVLEEPMDDRLKAILDDCKRYPLDLVSTTDPSERRMPYDQALCYVQSVLDPIRLHRNRNAIYVHKIDTTG